MLSLGLPDGRVPDGPTTVGGRHVAAAEGPPPVCTALGAAAVLGSGARSLFWTVAPRVQAPRFSSSRFGCSFLSRVLWASLHLLDAEGRGTPGLSPFASSLVIRRHSQAISAGSWELLQPRTGSQASTLVPQTVTQQPRHPC